MSDEKRPGRDARPPRRTSRPTRQGEQDQRRTVAPRRPAQQKVAPGAAAARTSWDALASWYDGWVGAGGSYYHQEVAVPGLLALLAARPGEEILDLGSGQGVLAPHISRAGANYTGVDASPKLVQLAKQHHSGAGRFLLGDATNLTALRELRQGSFDAVTFLLSLQDMDPLERAIAAAAWALKPGGRVVLLLTHPAFRIPRQSGWGYDEGRKLQYRRVDSYLSQLAVPLKPPTGNEGTTRSFHRSLGTYVNTLADAGLLVDRMNEIVSPRADGPAPEAKAAERARLEIPLFLAMRARKVG